MVWYYNQQYSIVIMDKNMNNNIDILFSILIANYNSEHFFCDCYKSILQQTYRNWEVIILDDCSTDNSIRLIQSLIATDSRFKLFFNDRNRGCGYTKGKLIDLAQGEICGFLDPDDALIPEAIDVSVKKHVANPNVSLAYSKIWACDQHLNPITQSNILEIPKGESFLTSRGCIVSHFASFKKKFYHNPIDSRLRISEDIDLYYKMEEAGDLLFINETLYFYRIHKGGVSTSNASKSLAWKIYVIISTCQRRNIDLRTCIENIVAPRLRWDNSIEYKIGKRIIEPLRFLRNKFRKIVYGFKSNKS